jgi:hypothetical protein
MKNPIHICSENLNIIYDLLQTLLKQIGESPLAREDREALNNFEINYKNFIGRTSSSPPDVEAAISSASGSAIHANILGMRISQKENYSDEVKTTAKILQDKASYLRNIIDTSEEFSLPYVFSINKKLQTELPIGFDSVSDHEKNIIELQAKLRSEIETFERDITKGNDEIEELKRKSFDNAQKSLDEVTHLRRNIEQLKSEISELQSNMIKEVGKAAKIAEESEVRSNEVDSQINELLGQNASKLLLVDYANTAETEGKSANSLRRWSLACMALTGAVLCLALYESLSIGLDWKQAIFKVFTAIALSVPAAYLARESAKHRSQQHINRRISLDLRAITPYIATLPTEEQNKIKSEVASKIFGMQENGVASSGDYPINFQELAKMIIEKIPTPK